MAKSKDLNKEYKKLLNKIIKEIEDDFSIVNSIEDTFVIHSKNTGKITVKSSDITDEQAKIKLEKEIKKYEKKLKNAETEEEKTVYTVIIDILKIYGPAILKTIFFVALSYLSLTYLYQIFKDKLDEEMEQKEEEKKKKVEEKKKREEEKKKREEEEMRKREEMIDHFDRIKAEEEEKKKKAEEEEKKKKAEEEEIKFNKLSNKEKILNKLKEYKQNGYSFKRAKRSVLAYFHPDKRSKDSTTIVYFNNKDDGDYWENKFNSL